MSNSTIVDEYIIKLSLIQTYLTYYAYTTIFILGNIGCILNIIILLRPNYRKNSCSSYILANTFANLFNLYLILAIRILTEINSWVNRAPTYCIIRQHISQVGATVARLYLVFACIDRWALTSRSVRIRSFAQMKVARVIIPAIPITWPILTIHVLFFQGVVNGQCGWTSKTYSIFYHMYNTVLTGIIIPSSMIIFGILCIRNIRQIQRRIDIQIQAFNAEIADEQNYRRNVSNKKANDYQLLFMILIQILVYLITNIPLISNFFYVAITINWTKSILQLVIDGFWANTSQLIIYLNFSSTFYIYTLTGSIFRKHLKRLFIRNPLILLIFKRD